MSALVEFQTTRWFGDTFRAEHPEIVRQCVDAFLRNDVPAYMATCTMLGAADLRAALPGMTMPAAIVVGDEDYATPVAMAEAMQRAHQGLDLDGSRRRASPHAAGSTRPHRRRADGAHGARKKR